MTEPDHRIRRELLDVAVRDRATAWRVQSQLGDIHARRLVPIIQACFSEVAPAGRTLRIERLELNLGRIDLDCLEDTLAARLGPALRAALSRWLVEEQKHTALRGDDQEVSTRIELLASFAETGTVPWWADAARPRLIDEALGWLLQHASGALIELLRRCGCERDKLLRIIRACEEARLTALCLVLGVPARAGAMSPDATGGTVRGAAPLETEQRSARAGSPPSYGWTQPLDLQLLISASSAAPETPARRWRDAFLVAVLQTAISYLGRPIREPDFWHEVLARLAMGLEIPWCSLAAGFRRVLGPNETFWPTQRRVLGREEEAPSAAAASEQASLPSWAPIPPAAGLGTRKNTDRAPIAASHAPQDPTSERAPGATTAEPSPSASTGATVRMNAQQSDAAALEPMSPARLLGPSDDLWNRSSAEVLQSEAPRSGQSEAGAGAARYSDSSQGLPPHREALRAVRSGPVPALSRAASAPALLSVHATNQAGGTSTAARQEPAARPRWAELARDGAAEEYRGFQAEGDVAVSFQGDTLRPAALAGAASAAAQQLGESLQQAAESELLLTSLADALQAWLAAVSPQQLAASRAFLRRFLSELFVTSSERALLMSRALRELVEENRPPDSATAQRVVAPERGVTVDPPAPSRADLTRPAALAGTEPAAAQQIGERSQQAAESESLLTSLVDALQVTAVSPQQLEASRSFLQRRLSEPFFDSAERTLLTSQALRELVEENRPPNLATAERMVAPEREAAVELPIPSRADLTRSAASEGAESAAAQQRGESAQQAAESEPLLTSLADALQAWLAAVSPQQQEASRSFLQRFLSEPFIASSQNTRLVSQALRERVEEGLIPASATPQHAAAPEREAAVGPLTPSRRDRFHPGSWTSPEVRPAQELDDSLRQATESERVRASLIDALRGWLAAGPPQQQEASRYFLQRFLSAPFATSSQNTRLVSQALRERVEGGRLLAATPPLLAPDERVPDITGRRHEAVLPQNSRSHAATPAPTIRHAADGPPADDAYVQNAGMVLLWPFLVHLFERLALMTDSRWNDGAATRSEATRNAPSVAAVHRAVGLLQHAVSGEPVPEEYQVPLAKVLCGMPLDEVLDFGSEVTAAEAQECENMLTAVLAYVPAWSELSIAELRCAFLGRKGVLSARDGTWLLRVERSGQDAVLAELPWTLSWVSLPWMDAPIHIEW